jgi:hypothetical protein
MQAYIATTALGFIYKRREKRPLILTARTLEVLVLAKVLVFKRQQLLYVATQ